MKISVLIARILSYYKKTIHAPFLRSLHFWSYFKFNKLRSKTRLSYMAMTFSSFYLLFSLFGVVTKSKFSTPNSLPTAGMPALMGSISGQVFHDFDADGTQDANETFGEAGVTVTATGADGSTASTTTDATGSYSITLADGAFPARIEFSGLPNYLSTSGGATSGTTVQFVSSTVATGVDLGVIYIDRYVQQNNPEYVVGCFTNGDPLHSSNLNSESVVSVEYDDSGAAPVMSKQTIWTMSEVGPLWGMTYDGRTETLYGAATLKRHAGLGPNGIGAIYMKDINDAANPGVAATVFYDFGSDVDDASSPVPDNATRFPTDLEQRLTGDNDDPDVFGLVMKRGLGGMDLSEDGNSMFIVNLYDRELYSISTNSPTAGSAVSLGGLWKTSSPCTNGVARPFAVKVYRGKVYVGVVCDGSTNPMPCTIGNSPCGDLTAQVYAYDLGTSTWSTVLSSAIPLTYQRDVWVDGDGGGPTYWQRWMDSWSEMSSLVSNNLDYQLAQPVLADLEFRDDGAMVLFFLDRTSMQLGYRAPGPNESLSSIAEQYFSHGDILVAGHDGMGSYTIENNGSFTLPTGTVTGTQTVSPTGPGGREFYADSWRIPTSDANAGGLAILPGSDQILLGSSDLVNFYSAGVMYLGNSDGEVDKTLEIYAAPSSTDPGGTFAKAGGLSNLEFLAETSPKQIGNRLWKDADADGIQDPGEDGINGVIVTLWKETAPSVYTQVASTTTASDADQGNGYFLFSDNSVGTQTWINGEIEVVEDMNYEIRIGLAAVQTIDATIDAFTSANASMDSSNDPASDILDSDATTSGVISFNSLGTGVNNHSLDIGVISCSITANASSNSPLCEGETINLTANPSNGTGTVTYSWSGPGFTSSDENPSITNITTAADGTYSLTVTDEAGCTATSSVAVTVNSSPTVSFTAPADLCIDAGTQTGLGGGSPSGGVYSGTGVTDDGNGSTYSFDPSAAGAGTHTITYTYTDGNGCTDTATDDVEVFNVPTASFTAPADLCIDAGTQTSLGGGSPSGGVYSGTGVTDDGNGSTYSFDPSAAGAGTHTITYTYSGGSGCTDFASDDIEVFALPTPSFTAPADLCIDAGTQTSLGGGSPSGGVYSGTGVTDDGNGSTYSFNPSTAGAGTHTITYTYSGGNGCMDFATDNIEIFALPTPSFTAPADLCIDAGTQTGLGGGSPSGGVYSGTGVMDDANGMTYSFDPSTAGAGTHTITYTYTDGNGCVNTASDDIAVFLLPSAVAPNVEVCIGQSVNIEATPAGGSGNYSTHAWAVTDAGTTGMTASNLSNADMQTLTVNATGLTAGSVTLTYTVTDDNACSVSTTSTVTINGFDYGDLPDPDYPTFNASNGARHCVPIVPTIYLGGGVDADADGQGSSMANGDDNDGSDDENGIELTTPLIPGYQACIDITAVVPAMTTAYVQGWIDFGGDGSLDAEDQIATNLEFTSSETISHCFAVPADATFDGGMAMMRFRISSTSDLAVTGEALDGEVEDYKISLAKVGNLVWDDRNFDGVQGDAADEPGLNDITVNLTWEGPDQDIANTADNETYSITTATIDGKDGIYYFCGLIAGNYSIDVNSTLYLTQLGNGNFDTDSNDGDNGVAVNISSTTSLTTAESGTSDMPGMINNFPNNQDDLTFDFGYSGLDFGDLPDDFNTTLGNSGAIHTYKPGLYLGSCVDFETDATTDPEAGTDGTGGDDNTNGLFTEGTCTGNDDEDGVRLISPLVPGSEACIEVTATSTDGTAIFNGWIDFNGDGDFTGDASELLFFTSADGSTVNSIDGPIPNGTSTQTFCFMVPSDASFEGSETHMRFRLSMNGTSDYFGLTPTGEVEDYYQPLAKIGNLVWEDLSNDGIQDAGEPGIENVGVRLIWAGPNGTIGDADDNTYFQNTDNNGNYAYCGLLPGEYKVEVVDPTDWTPATSNSGNDDFDDSDYMMQTVTITDPINLPTGEDGLTDDPSGTDFAPDNRNDLSVDFGFIRLDFGDLPDDFITLNSSGGPIHVIQPGNYLGSCVDAELDASPDDMAGTDGLGGDDNTIASVGQGTCTASGDEDGIAFITPMVAGHTACIQVTSTLPNGGGFLNAWIDFNGNGSFDTGEQVEFTSVDGGDIATTVEAPIAAGTDVITDLCFDVPLTAIFEGEETHLRFRLSTAGGLDADGLAPDGEVEDYYLPLAKLGNYVWEDVDGDGIQDDTEPGIENITVTLDATDALGNPYQAVALTNASGFYTFCGLLPTADMMSTYKLTFSSPGAEWIATAEDTPNNFGIIGDDTDNSDLDETTLMISDISLADREVNLDEDAGFLILAELGDYVWLDMDFGEGEDGTQQNEELRIEGAILTLYGEDALGRSVSQSMTTDENGNYLFPDLWPGQYFIEVDISMITGPTELLPYVQYLLFTDVDVTVDDIDSDITPYPTNPQIGVTTSYLLQSATSDLRLDAGLVVPCLPPTDLLADNIMHTTFNLSWQFHNDPVFGIDPTNHCWNIEIGGDGFSVGMGEHVIAFTICEGDPGLTIIDDRAYYDISGLQAGTCYDAYVAETCDGSGGPAPNTVGWTDNVLDICTYDYPPTADFTATAPSCYFGSANYSPDGSFDITIEDSESCIGTTYDITITPVADSAPDGSTPPMPNPINRTGVLAGTYTFEEAGPGAYTIEVTETGPCLQKPDLTPVQVDVIVPDAIDLDAPSKTVTDVLGNTVTDIGPFNLPEGDCSYQMILYVQGIDACDGLITAADAVTATATTLPTTIDPGTQVEVSTDGMGNYLIEANFSVGTTTLTISMEDLSGNPNEMVYVVDVEDNNDAIIFVDQANHTIPACEETITVPLQVFINDACDQNIDPTMVSLTANGTETAISNDPENGFFEYEVSISTADDATTWTLEYTDDFGNEFSTSIPVSVTQAVENQEPIIYAGSENILSLVCEEEQALLYSFQITDDCEEIDLDGLTIDDDDMGITLVNTTFGNNNTSVELEYSGDVAPGQYTLSIEYDNGNGQTAEREVQINIIEQADLAATIIMPSNLTFTLPQCQEEIIASIGIHIQDACDSPGIDGTATFYLDDILLTPTTVSEEGHFQFSLPITAANNGSRLVARYVDSAGNISEVEGFISVITQPDVLTPILIYPAGNIQVELEPCEESLTEVCFNVSAIDNCDGDLVPTITIQPTPESFTTIDNAGGSTYCMEALPGGYIVSIQATDNSGNITIEDFTVQITQDAAGTTNLSCEDNLYITLNSSCQAQVVPAMVLDGTFGCLEEEDFEIVVLDENTANGSIIDGCGEFVYQISLADGVEGNFPMCWGYITAEDKTPPLIECPADTSSIVLSGTEYDLFCEDLEELLIDVEQSYIASSDGTIVEIDNQLLTILSYTGLPNVSDNCGDVLVRVSDTYIENGDCGTIEITRTFEIEDKVNSACTGASYTATCQQVISLRKPGLDELNLPDNIVAASCDDSIVLDENGHPDPETTGFPTIETAFGLKNVDQTFCSLGASYEDATTIEVCSGTYEFIRSWTLIDWCDPGNFQTYQQIIQVGDSTGPNLTCPTIEGTYSTGAFECTAGIDVPLPTVSDNCSTWEVYTEVVTDVEEAILNQYGQVIGTQIVTQVLATIPANATNRLVGNIPIGCHRFRYIATDDCGNSNEIECDFCVEDRIEPIAICNDELTISINQNDGLNRIYADEIDEGSTDYCGTLILEVRRLISTDASCAPANDYYSEWSSFVEFNCCDVGKDILVELRATDESGNANTCWLNIYVDDEIAPICTAPANQSTTCDALAVNFNAQDTTQLQALFGQADALDNCGAYSVELTPIVNLDDCGYGSIIRRFQAIDFAGNSSAICQQNVTVLEQYNYEVRFPADGQASCGIVQADTIEYTEVSCDLLAISVSDEFFSASGDECYKIFRTYNVINWCEYDGISAPVVVGRDEDCDNNPGDEAIYLLVRPNGISYLDRDNNEQNNVPLTGTSRCSSLSTPSGHWANSSINTELTSTGYWQYTQHIQVYDPTAPVVNFTPADAFCGTDPYTCAGAVSVNFSILEECTPDDLTIRVFLDENADGSTDSEVTNVLTGSYPDYTIEGTYAIGQHLFELEIADGCGNTTVQDIAFTVADCYAPSPICINGLALELMPVEANTDADGDGDIDLGANEIWANDFLASPNPDCSAPVSYSINRLGATVDPDQTGLVLTCDDLGLSVQVEIYAWDSAYNPYSVQPNGTIGGPNFASCQTYILVQDNMFNLCGGAASITVAGGVATEEGLPVQGASILLSGQQSAEEMTDENGDYEFSNLEINYDFTILPSKDGDYLNGVSTLDLVLISRHILGIAPFESPYKIIAADVNNSKSVSTFDMVLLRRLILTVDLELSSNTSWRFVEKEYEFPNPLNPWEENFPEVTNLNNLAHSVAAQDFIAVKIGDVNGSAVPNNFIAVDEREGDVPYNFEATDIILQPGMSYEISISAPDMDQLEGYQYTLDYNPAVIELVDLEYALLKESNFGWRYLEEGKLLISWNKGAESLHGVAEQYKLQVVARQSGLLSDHLELTSSYLKAEGYNKDGELLQLGIDFAKGNIERSSIELYQNTPNPFRSETVIPFFLPETSEVTILVQDITGREWKTISATFEQGYNTVFLQKDELPRSGVLYYTLKTGTFKATRSMIIIE